MSDPDSITSPLRTCTKCGREHPATLGYFRAREGSKLHSWCKECLCEHNRAWRAANVERVAAYNRSWQADNPGYNPAYKLANRATAADQNRAYYASHVDERAAYGHAYHIAHPESAAASSNNRRARKLGNGGTHTAADVRAQYARQKGRCFYCDENVGDTYHVDHVMPVILGGYNGPENLVIACPACNLSKGAKHPQDFCGRLL